MATLPGAPPTKEIGAEVATSLGYTSALSRLAPWSQFIDDREYAAELVWPNSVRTFDTMRSDSQVEGLFFGLVQPILGYQWLIDPNGAEDWVVAALAKDIGLDIKDSEPIPMQRKKGRFNFYEHQMTAFLALLYGHYGFEQVGPIIDDPEWKANGGKRWQLHKLAPREPRTIYQINVAPDGSLISVTQNLPISGTVEAPEIPVDRLVWYPWAKEGANWVGRSMIRACYRNWLLKDKLLRIDVINHERAGGIPIAIAQEGATPTEIADQAKLAQSMRVTDTGGGALPYGSKLEVMRSAGSGIIESINYHDEQMARRFLLMVMQLGQTHVGARNLGEVFIDFFTNGQRSVANWFTQIFNEHVIEDWIDWNLGPDYANVPQLIYEDTSQNERLATADLVQLIEVNAIVVDEDLEILLRDRYNLGLKKEGAPKPEDVIKPPEPAPTDVPPAGGDNPSAKPAGAQVAASAKLKTGEGSEGSSGSLLPSDPPPVLFDQEVM
jgi:hypothetical protein